MSTLRQQAEAQAPVVQALLTKIWGQSFTLTDLIEVILNVAANPAPAHDVTDTL